MGAGGAGLDGFGGETFFANRRRYTYRERQLKEGALQPLVLPASLLQRSLEMSASGTASRDPEPGVQLNDDQFYRRYGYGW